LKFGSLKKEREIHGRYSIRGALSLPTSFPPEQTLQNQRGSRVTNGKVQSGEEREGEKRCERQSGYIIDD